MLRAISFTLIILTTAVLGFGDDSHDYAVLTEQQSGTVHFPTSCAAQVRDRSQYDEDDAEDDPRPAFRFPEEVAETRSFRSRNHYSVP